LVSEASQVRQPGIYPAVLRNPILIQEITLSYVRLANIYLKQVEPSGSAIKVEDLDSNAFRSVKELDAGIGIASD
jgi:hypothetical protein